MRRIMALILLLTMVLAWSAGSAEDRLIYILCDPESHVNVRKTPSTKFEETGRLDCGDSVMTDGRQRNGYIHVYGITEDGEGWIYRGYVVDDKPVIESCRASVSATGRVKSRRCIDGGKACWLQVCDEVTIRARSEEWAVTNRGYVRTEYLELWYE